MKLKSKLMAMSGILFLLVIVLATLNQVSITRLTEEARKITIENNTSIDFSKNMLMNLDTIQAHHQRQYFGNTGSSPDDAGRSAEYLRAVSMLDINIKAEENNITEPGEKEAVERLRQAFIDYQKAFHAIDTLRRFDVVTYYIDLFPKLENIRSAVYAILEINLKASNLKSNRPYELARQPAS